MNNKVLVKNSLVFDSDGIYDYYYKIEKIKNLNYMKSELDYNIIVCNENYKKTFENCYIEYRIL